MSTAADPTAGGAFDYSKPISAEVAKIMGITLDPAQPPPTMQDILNQRMAGNLRFFENSQAQTTAQIAEARARIINRNKGNVNPQQQQDIDQISTILGMYPQFIGPIKITVATMIRWQTQNQSLMDTYSALNPTKVLDLLGDFQNMLLKSVPREYWPEALRKEAEASEAAAKESAATPPST